MSLCDSSVVNKHQLLAVSVLCLFCGINRKDLGHLSAQIGFHTPDSLLQAKFTQLKSLIAIYMYIHVVRVCFHTHNFKMKYYSFSSVNHFFTKQSPPHGSCGKDQINVRSCASNLIVIYCSKTICFNYPTPGSSPGDEIKILILCTCPNRVSSLYIYVILHNSNCTTPRRTATVLVK